MAFYQINAIVPAAAASGTNHLVVSINGTSSQPVKIALK
jgi:uncharacterized protein (TIGR03437 family)